MSRWKSPATAARRAARHKREAKPEVVLWLAFGCGVIVIAVCLFLYSKGYLRHVHGQTGADK